MTKERSTEQNENILAMFGTSTVTIEGAMNNAACIIQGLQKPEKKGTIFAFIEKGAPTRFPHMQEAVEFVNQELTKEKHEKVPGEGHKKQPYRNDLLPLAILTVAMRLQVPVLYGHLNNPYSAIIRCLDDEVFQGHITGEDGEDSYGIVEKLIAVFEDLCVYWPGERLMFDLLGNAKTPFVRLYLEQKINEFQEEDGK